MRMHAVLSFLAGGLLLLAASHPAAAEGRVTFNDMVVQKCPDNGNCPWKLSCGVEGKPESEMFAGDQGENQVHRQHQPRSRHPHLPGGHPLHRLAGHRLDRHHLGQAQHHHGQRPRRRRVHPRHQQPRQGSVTVRMSVDSLEIFMPSAAAPAAAPATGKKPAAAARPQPTPQYLGIFNPEPEGRAVVVGLEWGAVQEAGGRPRHAGGSS